jgi:mannosyltransferase
VNVARNVRELSDAVPSDVGGYDSSAWGTPLDGVAHRAMRVPWLWPTLLMLGLGCYQLDRPELWRDELWSWSFAADPVRELVASASRSNPAELCYDLMLHYWMAAFGDSVLAMRMLSVLAMAGAAACVTLAGRRLAGPGAGLLAGLVFVLVPSVSRFAQEVRFYAPEVLAVALATLLLLRAMDAPSVRRWAAYGACLAVAGYIDILAVSVVLGHAAGVALRWWQDRDARQDRAVRVLLGFAAAAVAGLAACLPLAALSLGKAGTQVWWINRPGLDVNAFSFLAQNLFYSTSVAPAVIILGLLAWASWRSAAFATAMAVLPVGGVWLLSQGPHSYFIGRYLLLTVAAWALLAGIGLSRLDGRLAAVVVLVIAVFGAGDQQVIREPGGHNWPGYPVGSRRYYWDYAGAASAIAGQARAGDGIVYRDGKGVWWNMIGPGVQYYLRPDMPHGVPVPRTLFVTTTAPPSSQIRPAACRPLAACLGDEPRIWIVGSGYKKDPYRAVPAGQAALLRPRYGLGLTRHFRGLTVFLLVRGTPHGPPT